jgi:hypothetical protein
MFMPASKNHRAIWFKRQCIPQPNLGVFGAPTRIFAMAERLLLEKDPRKGLKSGNFTASDSTFSSFGTIPSRLRIRGLEQRLSKGEAGPSLNPPGTNKVVQTLWSVTRFGLTRLTRTTSLNLDILPRIRNLRPEAPLTDKDE